MSIAEGGCICGQVRYGVSAEPDRVTLCHCKFCQRATGGAYLVEPLFQGKNFALIKGEVKTYTHVSEGSGKEIHIHFCENCGTKLFMKFERFADIVGIYGGTFDDPDWFEISADTAKHIYLGAARHGTVIPAGLDTFKEHAAAKDGSVIAPEVFEKPQVMPK